MEIKPNKHPSLEGSDASKTGNASLSEHTSAPSTQKHILVSGATGLIGSALCKRLKEAGHRLRTLSRSSGDVRWDPEKGRIDQTALDGIDAVIHLAGEPIAQRWSTATKQRILKSRVDSTALLVKEILKRPQAIDYIGASGSNYYGFAVGSGIDETHPSGQGFLAEVCRAWEGAAEALVAAGKRAVFLRTGVVLSASGGALTKMLPPFKAGVGGRIASGQQWMSWVGLPDLVEMYLFALENPALCGPINAVAPEPVTNADFSKTLGLLLKRPTLLPVPAFAIRALFGEMGRETVLADVGLIPAKLQAAGFEWQTPDLESTLRDTLSGVI